MTLYATHIKRTIDVVGAAALLCFLSPIFGLAAVAILLSMGRPIVFRQTRPGRNEVLFAIRKFRTMTNNTSLSDASRITRLGRLLRTSSIDELPQLFNIVRGDMSFIGPRPLAVQYLPYYTVDERRRHAVRPGISGLAQVTGRNALDWEQRFALDLQYVDNLTLALDLKIVLLTLRKLLARSDIGVRGTGPIQDFDATRRSGPVKQIAPDGCTRPQEDE